MLITATQCDTNGKDSIGGNNAVAGATLLVV
jgi:hypothetical protein